MGPIHAEVTAGTLDGIPLTKLAAVLLGTVLQGVNGWTDRDLTTPGVELSYEACCLVVARLPACGANTGSLCCNDLCLAHPFPNSLGALCRGSSPNFGFGRYTRIVILHQSRIAARGKCDY